MFNYLVSSLRYVNKTDFILTAVYYIGDEDFENCEDLEDFKDFEVLSKVSGVSSENS